jgi:hypothetical protein
LPPLRDFDVHRTLFGVNELLDPLLRTRIENDRNAFL